MSLQDYLEQLSNLQKINARPGWKYNSLEELVLDTGKTHEIKALPKSVQRGTMKECFKNALLMARTSWQDWSQKPQKLHYVEGFAVSSVGLPVLHAWCVDQFGTAYDFTWETLGSEYRGIVFNMEFVLMKVLRNGYYGILGNDYLDDCNILRNGPSADSLAG